MKRNVFITGITGQDGSYLAEQHLLRGDNVHGLVRRNSTNNLGNIEHIKDRLELFEGDLTDLSGLRETLKLIQPDYVYNLAAQSHVGTSYDLPDYTMQVTGMGAMNLFQAVWDICPEAHVYQASSSEMFGLTSGGTFGQNEMTKFDPISPYAVAKMAAHQMAHIWRKRGLWVSCGILFNHESERRGDKFLTSKVAKAAAHKRPVVLGNLKAMRDWGYAPEYTEGMTMILEHPVPDDFVLATGKTVSVEDFVEKCYEAMGLNWLQYVTISDEFKRPVETAPLKGDATKAHNVLGWHHKTDVDGLATRMVDYFRTTQPSD
jgi:GDPmannose 4,6-dehydratase